MKEILITKEISNQRFDKMLKKFLPEAANSFIYKMLRKKNITLNGKKAEGNEILKEGDVVKLFFSDETFEKFSGAKTDSFAAIRGLKDTLNVVFEDASFIVINKPAGVLSQKAALSDVSINEIALKHLLVKGELTEDSYKLYHPSVVNRLDMYTTGLLLFAKTYEAARYLSDSIADRSTEKYYLTVVDGVVEQACDLEGYLCKDENANIVSVSDTETEGYSYCKTGIAPLFTYKGKTLLEVRLYTGRSHQIRAFLAHEGYPVLGDPKYGNKELNEKLRGTYGIKNQLLHAYRLRLPDGREFKAMPPSVFSNVLGGYDFGNI